MGKSKKVRIDTGRLVRSYPKLMNLGRGEARSKIVRMIKKIKARYFEICLRVRISRSKHVEAWKLHQGGA